MQKLTAEKVTYIYQGKYQKVETLKEVSCTFAEGNLYAVIGHSGSGKSTLLLTLGLRLWMETGEKLRQAEENFTTIGMVRQRENLMEAGPVWQAGTRSYL